MGKFSILRDKPVPSCAVNRVIWDQDSSKWEYEYLATIPEDVTIDDKGIFSNKLYVYGHIQQLYLVSSVTKNSVNIKIDSVQDVIDLVDLQYSADLEYRRKWIKKNPDYYENLNTCEYSNQTQESKYSHIIFVKEQSDDSTTFVVAPEKGVK